MDKSYDIGCLAVTEADRKLADGCFASSSGIVQN
jgi:hypothetical protein